MNWPIRTDSGTRNILALNAGRRCWNFQSYWGEHAKNPDNADKFLSRYSQASKDVIQVWRETAKHTDERNKGMTVYDDQPGAYRPIGSIADYFPRSVRPEVWEMVENGIKNRKEWERMVAALKGEGMIKSENEASSYLDKALKPIRRFDYLGNIEQARNLPLPNRAYDYSFNAARRYMKAWRNAGHRSKRSARRSGRTGKTCSTWRLRRQRIATPASTSRQFRNARTARCPTAKGNVLQRS